MGLKDATGEREAPGEWHELEAAPTSRPEEVKEGNSVSSVPERGN